MTDERVGNAQTILAFWPMSSEPDVRPVIRELHAEGKMVLLPRVISKTEMEFCPYTGDDSLVCVPPYGIMEPTADVVLLSDQEVRRNCLMLVPGVAFDKEGHRLGHGCGYYDCYLSKHPMPTVPVFFPFQMVDDVPVDEYDITI